MVVWLGLVAAVLFVSLSNYPSYQIGAHYDDARYIVLAQSLAFSNQYGMINAPAPVAPGKYPFGYPLLLAPILRLFPESLDLLKVPSLLATILNMVLVFWGWRWLRINRSRWWAVALCGLYGLSPLSIDLSRRVMSEAVFTSFGLMTFILVAQAVHRSPPWWWSPLTSTTLVFSMFTRTLGLLLVVSTIVYLLHARGRGAWKAVGLILLQMSALIGLIVAATPVQVGDLVPREYLSDENASMLWALPGIGERLSVEGSQDVRSEALPAGTTGTTNRKGPATPAPIFFLYWLEYHLEKDIRLVAVPIGGGTAEQALADRLGVSKLPAIFGLLISALVVLGFLRLLAQHTASFFLLVAVVYFGTLLGWVWNDPRLLYPIQFQIHLGLLAGLEALFLAGTSWLKLARRQMLSRFALSALVAILCMAATYKSMQIDDSRLHTGDIRARSAWIAAHADASAIVMSEAPEADYLYGGRKTVPYPAVLESPAQLITYLDHRTVDFVVLAPEIAWQTQYTPRYSEAATRLQALVQELSEAHRMAIVYASDPDLIRIYQVQR